tara:strand:- start:3126 stop:4847 length:1722 start_codon:yes stop_codon:yes gene_type:complete
MTENYNQYPVNLQSSSNSEEGVDLIALKRTIFRNKNIVGYFILSGVIISITFALSQRRTWEGQFQIVLDSNKPKVSAISQLTKNATLANLITSGKSDDQKTEVEILRSPSILMDIYKFAKEQSKLKGVDVKDWRFVTWKDFLNISLQKNTSVLNIAYRSKEKDTILPILSKISDTYQEYSGKERFRKLDIGLEFLDTQINIYKEKSYESARKAEVYGSKNNLSLVIEEDQGDENIEGSLMLNVELSKIKALNAIESIKIHIGNLNKENSSVNDVLYIAQELESSRQMKNRNTISQIDDLDNQLTDLRVTFNDSDRLIRDKLKRRNYLLSLLKINLNGQLKTMMEQAVSNLKAAERAPGVISQYKQLLTERERDKRTLLRLENEYRAMTIDQARSLDPWKLITKPTLLDYPVAPQRKRIAAIGLLMGIIGGSIASVLKEKREGIIYEIKDIESLIDCRIIENFPFKNKQLWDERIDLLANGTLNNYSGSIALIPIGKIDNGQLTVLTSKLEKAMPARELVITKEVKKANGCDQQILITSIGDVTSQELSYMQRRILLQDSNVIGLILLSKDRLI